MAVEVFKVEEVNEAGLSPSNDLGERERFAELATSLGLKGQLALLKKSDEPRPVSVPMPYRPMNPREVWVYGVLFPRHARLADFGSEAIPVRVLEVADEAIKSGMFASLEVWCDEGVAKDPILVGMRKSTQQHWEWQDVPHALARWGDALASFAELTTLAVSRAKSIVMAALRSAKQKVELDMARLSSTDDESIPDVVARLEPTIYASPLN